MDAATGSAAPPRTGGLRGSATILIRAWRRYWFAPSAAADLGVARAVFFACTFALYVGEDFSGWANVSPAFWMPIWMFRALHIPLASHVTLRVLQVVWKVALLAGAVGIFTRASAALAFVLGFYLLGLPHNFGHTYHFDAVLVFAFAILACAHAGDAWALDRLIWPGRTPAEEYAERQATGEYRWPVRLIWLATALVLFAAGLSKLRHSGLQWVFSDTMAIFLTKAYYHISDADPLVRWGLTIAAHPWLARGMAASALVVETCFPFALVSSQARRLLLPGAFGMLVAIRVLMGPTFGGFLAVFAFWTPWEAIGERLAAKLGRSPTRLLIYDGDCGLCGRTVSIVRALDLMMKVETRDAISDWPDLASRFPALDQDACLDEMHVISSRGEVFRGFRAYRALAWALPAGWLALPFAYLPGVPQVGDVLYRFVAARRSRSCALSPASERPAPTSERREPASSR